MGIASLDASEDLGIVMLSVNPKEYYAPPRNYALKAGTLREGGDNTIIVKVNDTFLNGGFKDTPFFEKNWAPWLNTCYLQEPVADDNPYRYYRW
jgi:hypothetical protein